MNENGHHDEATQARKRAYQLLGDGDYEAATRALSQLIVQQPNDAELYLSRGLAHYQLKRYAESVADLDEALRLEPNSADALFCRANAHLRLGNSQAALRDYDASLALKPDQSEAHARRAAVRASLGNYQGALDDYTRALQLLDGPVDQDKAMLRYSRATLRYNLGDYQAR